MAFVILNGEHILTVSEPRGAVLLSWNLQTCSIAWSRAVRGWARLVALSSGFRLFLSLVDIYLPPSFYEFKFSLIHFIPSWSHPVPWPSSPSHVASPVLSSVLWLFSACIIRGVTRKGAMANSGYLIEKFPLHVFPRWWEGWPFLVSVTDASVPRVLSLRTMLGLQTPSKIKPMCKYNFLESEPIA